MVRLVGFLRPSLKNCKYKTFTALLLIVFLTWAPSALAEDVWLFTRPSPSSYGPVGLNRLVDHWSNTAFNDYCYSNWGRAFNISVNNYDAIHLNGLSIMVWSPTRPLTSADWASLKLTILPGEASTLIGQDLSEKVKEGLSPVTDLTVFPGYKTNIGTYPYSYELLFKFPPVLLRKDKTTLTAILDCRMEKGIVVWGSQNIYPNGKSFLFKDGSRVENYLSDVGVQHTLYGNVTLLYRPVVLVHDLGGVPQDFDSNGYSSLLTGENFNPKFVKFFDFGSDSSGYKSFVDLRSISQKFTDDLTSLSFDYVKEGGDGKVDVVAFGLSNLVVKDHLSKNKSQNKVRFFISVGALNKGSWFVDMDRNKENFNPGGSKFNSKTAALFLPDLKKLNIISSGRDPASQASFLDQGRSDSPIVLELADIGKIPSQGEINYYNIMGDILVSVKQSLLGQTLTSQNSLGDGSVLTESARILCDSGDTSCSTTFTESSEVTRTLKRESGNLTYSVGLPDVSSFKFLHNKLISSLEVKNRIKEILTAF